VTTINNAVYRANTAGAYGGGMQTGNTQISNSLVQNNQSQLNGGGISSYGATVYITNTQFLSNATNGDGTYGGGAIAASGTIRADNSRFTGNTANTSPGGALSVGQSLYLVRSDFNNNTAVSGDGGAAFAKNGATLDQVTFSNNQSSANGGALAIITGTLGISRTLFISNFAQNGGGLYQYGGGGRIVNSLFTRNQASSTTGMDLFLAPNQADQVLFCTIAGPTLGLGDAVHITGGSVTVQDTIITNHAIGLYRQGGSVVEDYNLLYGNTIPTFGVITSGTHHVNSDPRFEDPATDNYHLNPTSPAIDAGLDTGLTIDIDGQARPQRIGFDIGYDEFFGYSVFLPYVKR
jgi:predicted outer membrane repeat protein